MRVRPDPLILSHFKLADLHDRPLSLALQANLRPAAVTIMCQSFKTN